MKRIITAVVAITMAVTAYAEPARVLNDIPENVLFIGNSYTFENGGTWNHVRAMAAAGSPAHDIAVSNSMRGGAMFKDHWNLTSTPDSIRKGGWDVVVLQGGTIPSKYLDTCIHYASLLKGLADSVGAQTVMFMTWEHRYISYENMSMAYDSVGSVLGIPVIPVGTAWHRAMERDAGLDLYVADRHHPNAFGTYLSTCMFQAAFTGLSPVGNPYTTDLGIPDSTAVFLQEVAWEVLGPYTGTAGIRRPADAASGTVRVICVGNALRVSVLSRQHVRVEVFGMDGNRLGMLLNGVYGPGTYDADYGAVTAGTPHVVRTGDGPVCVLIK